MANSSLLQFQCLWWKHKSQSSQCAESLSLAENEPHYCDWFVTSEAATASKHLIKEHVLLQAIKYLWCCLVVAIKVKVGMDTESYVIECLWFGGNSSRHCITTDTHCMSEVKKKKSTKTFRWWWFFRGKARVLYQHFFNRILKLCLSDVFYYTKMDNRQVQFTILL